MTMAPVALHEERFSWRWQGTPVRCGATRVGRGERALLLPALSSISTRAELVALQKILSTRYETAAVDWPGFGTADKPGLDWTPEALSAFLAHILERVVPDPVLIVAAGHSAGYVLRHFVSLPDASPDLALVAPTWRGPLPTMMDRRPSWLGKICRTMDVPIVGQALYALNLSRPVIGRMARGHVYTAPDWLTRDRMASKRHVARAKGARFASIRFVTGALDPFTGPEDACAAVAAIPAERFRFIWGADTPRKSKASMEMLARAARVSPVVLPKGKLGVHEEFPEQIAEAILAPEFLGPES